MGKERQQKIRRRIQENQSEGEQKVNNGVMIANIQPHEENRHRHHHYPL